MNSFLSQTDARITEAEVTLSGTTITVLGPTDGAPLSSPGRIGAAVTYTAVDTPTGPYHDSNTANYSGGALPVNGDTLIFRDGDGLMGPRYGTSLSAVTLAKIIVERTYNGRVGLPDNRGSYLEFREKRYYTKSAAYQIDNGNRGTIDRLRFGSTAVAALVSAVSDARVAALDFAGITGAGTKFTLLNCGLNLGVSTAPGDGLTADAITASNASIIVGPGYTVAQVKADACAVELRGVATDSDLDGSLVTVSGGELTNANAYNGTSIGFKTGTAPTAIDMVSSAIDFTGATAQMTAPTLNVGGPSQIIDPFGRLTTPWTFTLFEGTGPESVTVIAPKTGKSVRIS